MSSPKPSRSSRRRWGIAAALLGATALSGCAVLTVDVDVYKGPLANHRDVQTEQLAIMAEGAHQLLTILRQKMWQAEYERFLKNKEYLEQKNNYRLASFSLTDTSPSKNYLQNSKRINSEWDDTGNAKLPTLKNRYDRAMNGRKPFCGPEDIDDNYGKFSGPQLPERYSKFVDERDKIDELWDSLRNDHLLESSLIPRVEEIVCLYFDRPSQLTLRPIKGAQSATQSERGTQDAAVSLSQIELGALAARIDRARNILSRNLKIYMPNDETFKPELIVRLNELVFESSSGFRNLDESNRDIDNAITARQSEVDRSRALLNDQQRELARVEAESTGAINNLEQQLSVLTDKVTEESQRLAELPSAESKEVRESIEKSNSAIKEIANSLSILRAQSREQLDEMSARVGQAEKTLDDRVKSLATLQSRKSEIESRLNSAEASEGSIRSRLAGGYAAYLKPSGNESLRIWGLVFWALMDQRGLRPGVGKNPSLLGPFTVENFPIPLPQIAKSSNEVLRDRSSVDEAYNALASDELIAAHAKFLFRHDETLQTELIRSVTTIAEAYSQTRIAIEDLLTANLEILANQVPASRNFANSTSQQALAEVAGQVSNAIDLSMLRLVLDSPDLDRPGYKGLRSSLFSKVGSTNFEDLDFWVREEAEGVRPVLQELLVGATGNVVAGLLLTLHDTLQEDWRSLVTARTRNKTISSSVPGAVTVERRYSNPSWRKWGIAVGPIVENPSSFGGETGLRGVDLARNADGSQSLTEVKKRATSSPGIQSSENISDRVKSLDDLAVSGRVKARGGLNNARLDDGIFSIIQEYLRAYEENKGKNIGAGAAAEAPESADLVWKRQRLSRALVRFAQKILPLANNLSLFEENLFVLGGLQKSNGDTQNENVIRVLQTVGNSILVQADAMRKEEAHEQDQRGRQLAEVSAIIGKRGTGISAVYQSWVKSFSTKLDALNTAKTGVEAATKKKAEVEKKLAAAKQSYEAAKAKVTTAPVVGADIQKAFDDLNAVWVALGEDPKTFVPKGAAANPQNLAVKSRLDAITPGSLTADQVYAAALKIVVDERDTVVAGAGTTSPPRLAGLRLAVAKLGDAAFKNAATGGGTATPASVRGNLTSTLKSQIAAAKDTLLQEQDRVAKNKPGYDKLVADRDAKKAEFDAATEELKAVEAEIAQLKKGQNDSDITIYEALLKKLRDEKFRSGVIQAALKSSGGVPPFAAHLKGAAIKGLSPEQSIDSAEKKVAGAGGHAKPVVEKKPLPAPTGETASGSVAKSSSSDDGGATDAKLIALVGSIDPVDDQASTFIPTENAKTAQEVLDELIAVLRHSHLSVVERFGSGTPQASKSAAALAEALKQRSEMIYLRPAADYLRTSITATTLQNNQVGWQNQLEKHIARSGVPIFPALEAKSSNRIESEIDTQFWQNINRVRVAGGGDTNYVVAKDDVGNWYVKNFSADPDVIVRSATNLASFAIGGAGGFTGATGSSSETPAAAGITQQTETTLERQRRKFQQRYYTESKQELRGIVAKAKAFEGAIETGWKSGAPMSHENLVKNVLSVEVAKAPFAALKVKVVDGVKDEDAPGELIEALRTVKSFNDGLMVALKHASDDIVASPEERNTAISVVNDVVLKNGLQPLIGNADKTASRYGTVIEIIGQTNAP